MIYILENMMPERHIDVETIETVLSGAEKCRLWTILGGTIIAVIGIFIFLKPDLVWELTEKWKSYRADEPSDSYLKSTKFGGALFVLLGIVMIILPLILE